MLAKFGGAAAGQNGDELLLRIEILLAAKGLAIERGVHRSYQRMTDEFHGDASFAVELFFKWENAESLREAAADYADAPRAPGPELRADVVDVFNATAFEFAGEAQVEAGEIGEDCEGGFAPLGLGDKMAHGAHERRKMAEDFGDAYDGDFGIIGDDVDSIAARCFSAAARRAAYMSPLASPAESRREMGGMRQGSAQSLAGRGKGSGEPGCGGAAADSSGRRSS